MIYQLLTHLLLTSLNVSELDSLPHQNTKSSSTGVHAIVVPYLAYTPETRFQGGVGMVLTLRQDTVTQRPSALVIGTQLTQQLQYGMGLYPELYLDRERWRITGFVEYFKFPYDFYGFGNSTSPVNIETYRPEGVKFTFSAYRSVTDKSVGNGLAAGIRFDARHDAILGIDPRTDGTVGPLGRREITGSEGGFQAGVGPAILFDTRDNIFSAQNGWYIDAAMVAYDNALGSEFEAVITSIDLRGYVPLGKKILYAGHILYSSTTGRPKFQTQPRIGGESNLRGVYIARYRDRTAFSWQNEVRIPVWWRFGAVAFADLGQVATDLDKMSVLGFHVGVGAGIRFLLDEDERIGLRFDVGTHQGDLQFYIGFNEVF